MAELLRNPEKTTKAQTEMNQVLGKDGFVQESQITKLTYIQAIVKETLRLHHPIPFLLHKTTKNEELCGYFVPENSQVLVNVWSIGRDSSVWPNPLTFSPERFLDSEFDVKGQHFELLPFGVWSREKDMSGNNISSSNGVFNIG